MSFISWFVSSIFTKNIKIIKKHINNKDGNFILRDYLTEANILLLNNYEKISEIDKYLSFGFITVTIGCIFNTRLEWPPYSPDINPCDFYLWGHLKDRVYRTPPRTLDDLKKAITEQVKAIESQVLERVVANFEKRLRDLIASDGGHFENLIH